MEIIVIEQIRDLPIKGMRGYRVDVKHTVQDRADEFQEIYRYRPDTAWRWGDYVYFKERIKKP